MSEFLTGMKDSLVSTGKAIGNVNLAVTDPYAYGKSIGQITGSIEAGLAFSAACSYVVKNFISPAISRAATWVQSKVASSPTLSAIAQRLVGEGGFVSPGAKLGAAEGAAAEGALVEGTTSEGAYNARFIEGQKVKTLDGKALEGTVDIEPTMSRIEQGIKLRSKDGTVFRNDELLLPEQPSGYYKEWMHPTPGVSSAGPQRIIVGQGGDAWYTPNHYESFTRVR